MNRHTKFNYILNSVILIAGIIMLVAQINIFLGISWICIGASMILLQRLVEISFEKQKKRHEEFFDKLREVLGIGDDV